MTNIKNILFALCILTFISFLACGSDDTEEIVPDDDAQTELDYHAHIHMPTTNDKHVGDTMHIHVEMEDHNGGTVHHANIKIYNKDNVDQVIYSKPDEAHVHDEDGVFEFHDNLILDVEPHTDWILEAKVWGHEAGASEVMETVEFHVHPM